MKNHVKAMSFKGSFALLAICAAIISLSSCGKKSSSDNPLPVNYNPSIILGSDNYIVYAIDPNTGKRNWEFATHSPIHSSPIVYNACVYICTDGADTIYKVNSKTGKLIARWPYDFGGMTATPIADNGLLYVAGLTSSTIYAIDTGSGLTKWTYVSDDGTPIESSPVLYNGHIYFATLGGSVYCINASIGGTLTADGSSTAPIWTLNIPGASFHSSPAIAPPYLYIGSSIDSNMYCIFLEEPTIPGTGTGVIRWQYKANGPINSSPAAYRGRCIFGCDDFGVYCLDTAVNPPTQPAPDLIWINHTDGRVTSSPFVANQVVYVGNDNAFLYAINIINGATKWRFQTNGAVQSSPLVYNGTVYIGSSDKNLYAIDSTAGTLKWFYNLNGIIRCSPAIDNFTGAQVNSQISGYTQSGTDDTHY